MKVDRRPTGTTPKLDSTGTDPAATPEQPAGSPVVAQRAELSAADAEAALELQSRQSAEGLQSRARQLEAGQIEQTQDRSLGNLATLQAFQRRQGDPAGAASTATTSTSSAGSEHAAELPAALAQQPAFAALSAEDQQKFAAVYAASGQDKNCLALLDRLEQPDLRGGRMLDALHQLATQELAPGLKRKRLLKQLSDEIVHPGKIDQSEHGTCGVTGPQYSLVREHPAEYARLIAGLSSRSGRVPMAGGQTLTRVRDTLEDARPGDQRSRPERLLQAALMDYANGRRWEYFDQHDVSARINQNDELEKLKGLNASETDLAIEALFGQRSEIELYDGPNKSGASPDDPRFKEIMQKLEQQPEAMGWVSLQWTDEVRGIFGNLIEKPGNHLVTFLKVEDGRVYYRNPQGEPGPGRGVFGSHGGPPRNFEDRKNGIESMSLKEFSQRMLIAFVPAGSEGD